MFKYTPKPKKMKIPDYWIFKPDIKVKKKPDKNLELLPDQLKNIFIIKS